jgi:hypothetical protein
MLRCLTRPSTVENNRSPPSRPTHITVTAVDGAAHLGGRRKVRSVAYQASGGAHSYK